MSKLLLRFYWNPLLYLFGTGMMFAVVVGDRGKTIESVLGPFFVVVVLGLVVWFFTFFFLAWPIAIVQIGYGWWRYQRTGDTLLLHFCWSGLVVATIYAVTFILFRLGYYPDA